MPKKKYIKRPFPRKGVDWDKIKRERRRDEILSDKRESTSQSTNNSRI